MPHLQDQLEFQQRVLAMLATYPDGAVGADLQRMLGVSQPSMSRLLKKLRAQGLIIAEGKARNTRYHAVGGRLALSALRSRRLHEVIARKLVDQPELLNKVKTRLTELRQANPAGRRYHDTWERLLEGPLPQLLRKMTEDSEDATQLRRESPFTVLLTPGERRAVFEQFSTVPDAA